MKKNVLVVPAGTEIAHEIYESLRFSKHWNVSGANSVPDHSDVTFDETYYGIPFVDDENFLPAVQALVEEKKIDFVIPAHDEALVKLAGSLKGCVTLAPDRDMAQTLRLKSETLNILAEDVPVPQFSYTAKFVPCFAKPDRGQGARGASLVKDWETAKRLEESAERYLFQEYLPGEEVTIDCFSSKESDLLYSGARRRERVNGGIATRMRSVKNKVFSEYASRISKKLKLSGAWFFQMKQDALGTYKLLEVSNRIAGSSAFQRMCGVNLIDAWLHQLSGSQISFCPVVLEELVYDRALYGKAKISFQPTDVYVDFDDTIKLEKCINFQLVGLLFGLKDRGARIYLITRHAQCIDTSVKLLGISGLFDDILHLKLGEPKSVYVKGARPLFIDDSFRERKEVAENSEALCLPPEACDLIEAML